MSFLDDEGLTDDTMIVFTSDHGNYLGDHWMGEKKLFHDASARIPLIVVDPSSDADATRGLRSHALVEAIDVAPTILDYFGGTEVPHRFCCKFLIEEFFPPGSEFSRFTP